MCGMEDTAIHLGPATPSPVPGPRARIKLLTNAQVEKGGSNFIRKGDLTGLDAAQDRRREIPSFTAFRFPSQFLQVRRNELLA